MIRARIHEGRIEIQEPIPPDWEGQSVKILPLTPEDPLPDLEERLAVLEALGPVELDADERQAVERLLNQLDKASLDEMQKLADANQ